MINSMPLAAIKNGNTNDAKKSSSVESSSLLLASIIIPESTKMAMAIKSPVLIRLSIIFMRLEFVLFIV